MAAFDALYAVFDEPGRYAEPLPVMTMRDAPAATAAWQQRCTPSTFTSNVRQKSDSPPTPAFVTRRSTWPISPNAFATDSCDATSIGTARPAVSDATSSIWSRERADT